LSAFYLAVLRRGNDFSIALLVWVFYSVAVLSPGEGVLRVPLRQCSQKFYAKKEPSMKLGGVTGLDAGGAFHT
jgi:hypothetical protein